jgi:hypothetical protein
MQQGPLQREQRQGRVFGCRRRGHIARLDFSAGLIVPNVTRIDFDIVENLVHGLLLMGSVAFDIGKARRLPTADPTGQLAPTAGRTGGENDQRVVLCLRGLDHGDDDDDKGRVKDQRGKVGETICARVGQEAFRRVVVCADGQKCRFW